MVNVFITSTNLEECARNLDYRRLGKQRLECIEIIEGDSWKNHPCYLMWKNNKEALKIYFNHILREWISRGFQNSLAFYSIDESKAQFYDITYDENTYLTTISNPKINENSILFPKWFCWKPLILSQRASLLRKDEVYYSSKFEKTIFFQTGYLWMNTLETDFYEKPFNLNMCSPIGTGAPIQYRITLEDAILWSHNKNINPKTGKKIKVESKGGLYSEYKKACLYYKIDF